MIKVSEIMTRNVSTLNPDDSVEKACQAMAAGNFRHLPIVENAKLVGLVSHRDLLRYGISHFIDDHSNKQQTLDRKIRLKDIMTSDVKTVHPNDSLRHCGLLLQQHRFGCLPVVSDKKLVGIITDTDFVAIAINLIEMQDQEEEVSNF